MTAPGSPGITPNWTSSAKISVGTALGGHSNVWFTISHGIINEIYFPRIDVANTRDMGFVVTDGNRFFSEEKRHCEHEYYTLGKGIPAHYLVNTCHQGHYRIEKTVITDTLRNVVIQKVKFIPLKGQLKDYRMFGILAPHLHNEGMGNNGWTGDYKGHPMLFADHKGCHLAFSCSVPFKVMSCGYVGHSDPWQDLNKHKYLKNTYQRAENGNIGLGAEIDLEACQGCFIIAIGFGFNSFSAALHTRAALYRPFEESLLDYMNGWEKYQNSFIDIAVDETENNELFRISTAVIKVHEGKHFDGSVISSLSIPWGFSKGDNDLGGYHLIWPRDQVQTSIGMLAMGEYERARKSLLFLKCTQEADGHWSQCMWADGFPYWSALQLDETALPILLVSKMRELGELKDQNILEMLVKASRFLIHEGPTTQQDRWEEESGYTPFTLATCIAALLAAADILQENGMEEEALYLLDAADWWYANIDRWLYVCDTSLTREYDIEGYYVRVAPMVSEIDIVPDSPQIMLKNLPQEESYFNYYDIVSCDALALVRYGLRDADDVRIVNTVKVIDGLLKSETVRGPIWHRYNHDGYGEKADGSPFDGIGIGRGWPLLVGERAHYELIKGDIIRAKELLNVMENYAGTGGMLPEQVWDQEDIPERALFNGHSTGSAKPLVWAHAEYLTLLRSIKDKKSFSMPSQTVSRYLHKMTHPKTAIWRFKHKCPFIRQGLNQRIQLESPAFVHYTFDDWVTSTDIETKVNRLGVHYADIPSHNYPPGTVIIFTFLWSGDGHWEGTNFSVLIVE